MKTEEREEEEEYAVRKTERKQDPREPSADERPEHEKTHLLFRSWCRHCVRGRVKDETCREGKRSPNAAELHMDFLLWEMREAIRPCQCWGRAKGAEG